MIIKAYDDKVKKKLGDKIGHVSLRDLERDHFVTTLFIEDVSSVTIPINTFNCKLLETISEIEFFKEAYSHFKNEDRVFIVKDDFLNRTQVFLKEDFGKDGFVITQKRMEEGRFRLVFGELIHRALIADKYVGKMYHVVYDELKGYQNRKISLNGETLGDYCYLHECIMDYSS